MKFLADPEVSQFDFFGKIGAYVKSAAIIGAAYGAHGELHKYLDNTKPDMRPINAVVREAGRNVMMKTGRFAVFWSVLGATESAMANLRGEQGPLNCACGGFAMTALAHGNKGFHSAFTYGLGGFAFAGIVYTVFHRAILENQEERLKLPEYLQQRYGHVKKDSFDHPPTYAATSAKSNNEDHH